MSALDEMFPSGRPRVYGDTVVAPEAAPEGAPPAPVAQVGAEAPIAPPSSARRDIFAQLGLPNSALERLDQAVARSDTATTDALAALAGTRQQRAGVLEDMEGIERPGAPNIRDLPARPETPPRDNLRVFGQFLPVLAMLGGALNRNSATAALRAGTAALRAAQENDAEALARANAEWEQNVNLVLRQNDQAIQQFNAATTLYRTDIDGALAQLNALAAQEQNPVLQAQVAAGDLNAITGLFNARTAAYTAVSNAEAERQRINIARQAAQPSPNMEARFDELRQTENVLNAIEEARRLAHSGTTGVGALGRHFPGTEARDLQGAIDTIVANIGFDRLQAMREASPTGGALGNVTERELLLLQRVVDTLDPEMRTETFRNNLANVERQYLESMGRIRAAYIQDFGALPGARGGAPSPAGGAAPGGAAPAAPDPLGIR